MAEAQYMSMGFPFPSFINEVDSNSRLGQGVFVNETISTSPPPAYFPVRNKIILDEGAFE